MKKTTVFDSYTDKNQYPRLLVFIFFILWAIGMPSTTGADLRINSVTPDHGGRNESTELTIKGEGFSSEDRVAIWGGGTYIKASHTTKGRANALDCSGSYAYLACGIEGDPNSRGIQIFNIQDPSAPLSVKFFSLPEVANDIDIVGNYAYVAASGAGLYILDVQDPVTPSLVSSLLLPGKAKKLCVYGIYLYMAAKDKGLHIIDISNLSVPKIKGSCPLHQTERASDVIAEGNYAYLATGESGLKIIDITDPNNPVLSKSFDENSGPVCNVYKRNNYLYLSEYDKGIEILDVSDVSDPDVLSKITTQHAYQVYIEGNFLYVADGKHGIKIFDHDDENPQGGPIVGFQETIDSAKDLHVFNDNIFIADEDEGLVILDAKNPRNPSIASIVILDQSSEPKVAGLHLQDDYDYLYVFSKEDSNWLKILDVSDPQNPSVSGTTYTIGSNPEDLTVKDDIAYLVGNDGLEVFKVEDSGYPTRIKISAYYNARGIYLKEDYLFFACAEDENKPATTLKVLSLQDDPDDPGFVNDIDMDPNHSLEAVSGTGDYLMLAKGRGGMEIFTIQDPSQPGRVCGITYANSDIKNVLVSGEYAYLADVTEDGMFGLLRTVKITDPSNPDLRSSYITKEKPLSLTLSDKYLYLIEEESAEIEIFDVGQPEYPQVVALLPTLTSAVEIVSDGVDYVYLAMKTGIMAIRALRSCPGDPICINETTLTVSTPTGLAAGTYNISVAGPEGGLAVLPNGFTVEGNRPPVFIEPIFNHFVYIFEGEEYSFSIIASDPDGDPLSYSASLSVLPGANLEGNDFSWTPIVGQYPDVLFTVSDGEFTVEQKITILVEEDPDPNTDVNASPELFVPSSPQAGEEGIVMSFLVEASDPDSEDLTTLEISMVNAPEGAELQSLGIRANKMTACFLWTPTYQQAGDDHTITFTAKDRHSSEDQEIVSLHIQGVSGSPGVNFITGANFWLCPAGRSNYSSFDFLREHGEDAIYSLHAYDWDMSLLYSSYWFFGKPSGGNILMNKSLLYIIYTKKEISFNWPLNF